MNPQLSVQYLTKRLKSLRNFMLLHHVAGGMALILAVLFVVLVIGVFMNAAFFLTATFRTIFVVITLLALAVLFADTVLRRVVRRPSTEAVALKVEGSYPELQDRLIASLQLEKNLLKNREGFSTEMIQAVIQQSEEMCRGIDFKKSVDGQPLKKNLKYFGSSALGLLLVALLFPGSFSESIYLYSHPTLEVARSLSYTLDVLPKNVEVAKFSPVKIEALLYGKSLPEKATLHWRYQDGPEKSEELVREAAVPSLGSRLLSSDTAKLSYEFREVKKSLEYRVVAGEIESPVYRVTAVDKPRVIGLKLTYMYPAYTALQPLVVDENDGNISAIKGTKVKVEASLNKPVVAARMIQSSGQSQELEISKQKVTGTISVLESGSYHIAVTDELGNDNPDPIEYRIESIADMYPEVDLYSPGVPVQLGDDMALTLGFKLFDDFGFSALNLVYRVFSVAGETFERKISLVFDRKAGRNFEMAYPWDLSDLGLEPGGWIEYYVEAFDNDNISGPKRGVSQVLTVRLPSLDEQFAYLEEEGEAQIDDLEKLKEAQEELLQKTEKLQEELLTNKEIDWEKKQEIEKAVQAQQNVLDAMQKVADRLKQMEEQMRKNDLTSLEILQKLQELQKLFNEVATQEMKDALRKLQEQLDKMSPEEREKLTKEMEVSQQELKEKIERSIALLKFMRIQQKMENMMRQLEELVKQQENVNQQTDASAPKELPELVPREDQNKKEFDKLVEQAKELEEMLREMKLDQLEAAQKFINAPRKSKAGEMMSAMSAKLAQMDKREAKVKGDMALEDLQQMQKEMEEQKNSLNSSMGMESAEKMKQAANDVLYVSDQQEEVYNKAEQSDPTSPQLQRLASEQQALQRTLQSLEGRLKEIAKESAFYSDQINKLMSQARQAMEQSTTGLIDRNGTNAMRSQKDAMFSLNQAANQLLQSMQNQKQCSGGSCSNENLFKKMNKLCNSQKQINMKSSAMCNNPSRGSSDKQAMGRLAADQKAVQKSLTEMERERGNRKEILGRLDELGKEVKKVVEDLEGGALDENTLRRQQQIHSRMLDFQRSLERQDFSEERKAETAEDIVRNSPPSLRFDLPQSRDSYQDRLQKYLNEGYPPEYEELVKEYFRAINNGQPRQ